MKLNCDKPVTHAEEDFKLCNGEKVQYSFSGSMKYSMLKSKKRWHRRKTHCHNEKLLFAVISHIIKNVEFTKGPRSSEEKMKFAQMKNSEHQDGASSTSDQGDCIRFVFNPTEEAIYSFPEQIHYYISTKLFYQNIEKCTNKDLPRKTVRDAWNSLETVVFVKNSKLETKFEEIKAKFKLEGKVDAYGNVSELLLFHGTSNESINKIVEHNFCLDQKPDGPRNKVTLFGHGIYFSELPGVSLMYGTGLLLCKVILGKSQRYIPNGSPPPDIPDEFDSRVVIKDGIEVVSVVKNPAQILPYCILNIKQDRIENAGVRSIQQQQQNNQVKILSPG